MKVEAQPDGGLYFDTAIDEKALFSTLFQDAMGSRSKPWADRLFGQMINVGDGDIESRALAAAAFINGFAPADEVEAGLAAQMWAMLQIAMTMAHRTVKGEHPDSVKLSADAANKAARTYAAQLEALAKRRGGGRQEVKVTHEHRHVYVAPGGQAIVGDGLTLGGGGRPEIAYQPDAAAVELAMAAGVWGENPERAGLPLAGGEGPETMPNAWRGARERSAQRAGERALSPRAADEGGDGGAACDAGTDPGEPGDA